MPPQVSFSGSWDGATLTLTTLYALPKGVEYTVTLDASATLPASGVYYDSGGDEGTTSTSTTSSLYTLAVTGDAVIGPAPISLRGVGFVTASVAYSPIRDAADPLSF
eukprot:CAMPEP_0173317518 /NCGR_PEP_ID=MMETSP1143-20121109/27129_1 /TAXON_ID=483371 /ORGANISM="non described non described, Strain CCMP2298" /LENGTH=106 /DNA_ID=CAMNT_0014260627 /DNA_START=24 /DNA_END=341 /DNA_ORIENTATION=-